jgi:hypothetical protein
MKKVSIVLLVFALLASLAACGIAELLGGATDTGDPAYINVVKTAYYPGKTYGDTFGAALGRYMGGRQMVFHR